MKLNGITKIIAIGAISVSMPLLTSCQDTEKQTIEHKNERIILTSGSPLSVSIVTVSGEG